MSASRRMFWFCITITVVTVARGIAAQSMSQDDIVQAIEQGSAPADQHDALEAFLGDWNIETVMSLGPEVEPLSMRSHAHGSWTLGGRFLEFAWEANEGERPAYAGKYVLGFDTRFSNYTIVAMDTFGTYWVAAKGEYDEATGVFTFDGDKIEPGIGLAKFRFTFEPNDEGMSLSIQYFNPQTDSWVDGVKTTFVRIGS